MDYEQRYKEALDNAKVVYKTIRKDLKPVIEQIFPELAESDDERIRKQIISFLKEFEYDHYRSLDFSSWIAWLEKQGEQSSNISWHDVSEEPDANREIFCEWKSSTGTWHSIVFYHAYSKTFCEGGRIIKNVLKWTYVDKMLEKQGEQNSVDNVEPIFHEGDWIISKSSGSVHQIKSCIENTISHKYGYDLTDGDYISSDVVNNYRLWTIQDAKDGDVLAGKIDGDSYILIYKQIKDGWIETYGHYYDSVDRFCVPSQLFCREVKGTFRPATNEQRDLLFQKMKEAGYEWNADKKELIKL